ncbi:hypothetical protein U6N30_17350 [Blastococcus brunescens]|uniref:Uncharacterized protein n=1 Tax=Blastococcus brunescens TaxID=1564165 RepID=A0ABZ1ATV3_9ACTN|nr:hypothetical protein [Blastococcus sp. BMG 8361]WRL61874.1 hypothetical protein U6N30_17350 [Blastococcus sp. BMG 8361]
MLLLRELADVVVPTAEFERPRDRRLLILDGGAGQVDVHLVRAGLGPVGRQEPEAEPGVVVGQEHRGARGATVSSQPRIPAQKRESRAGSRASQHSATNAAGMPGR